MEILGIGPLEFLIVLVLALVIMGPQDMVSTARRMGNWIYRAVRSPTWRAILQTTQDLRDLPQKIVRDAGLEETMKEVTDTVNEAKSELNQATQDLSREVNETTAAAANEMGEAIHNVNEEIAETRAEIAADAAQSSMDPFSTVGIPIGLSDIWIAPNQSEPQVEGTTPVDVIYNGGISEPKTYAESLDTLALGLGAGTSSAPILPPTAQSLPAMMVGEVIPVDAERVSPVEGQVEPLTAQPEVTAEEPGAVPAEAEAQEQVAVEDTPAAPQEITPAMLAAVPQEMRAMPVLSIEPTETPKPAPVEPAPETSFDAGQGSAERLQASMDKMEEALRRLDAKVETPQAGEQPPAE